MKKMEPNMEAAHSGYSRRGFLQLAGGLAGMGFVAGSLAACNKKDGTNPGPNTGINLGSGDTGVLNYAYALEQLEAAFYIQVINMPFSGMTDMEMSMLTDIRDHEIAHREFFKNALAGNAIQDLEVNFSAITFSSRESVLTTAKTFEDLGVSAYNGAGKLLVNGDFLLAAGKIVSVEARHAAALRDMLNEGSFADMSAVDANGLDLAKMPNEVLAAAAPFLKSKLNASNLPTS